MYRYHSRIILLLYYYYFFVVIFWFVFQTCFPAIVAQFDALLTGDQEVASSTPPGRQHSFVEINHNKFSTVILAVLLIQHVQEGQL